MSQFHCRECVWRTQIFTNVYTTVDRNVDNCGKIVRIGFGEKSTMLLPISVYIHETPSGLIVSFDFPEGQVLGLYADDGVLIEQINSEKALSLISQSRPRAKKVA
jgi:hypothetical protein